MNGQPSFTYEPTIFSLLITLCHIVIVVRSCEKFYVLILFLDLVSNCYLNPTETLSYSWNRYYKKTSFMKVGKEKKNDGKIDPKWVGKVVFHQDPKDNASLYNPMF